METKEYMTKQEILNKIEMLAMSQGLYGRILRAIKEGSKEDMETRLQYLEDMHFKDSTDLVLYFEC